MRPSAENYARTKICDLQWSPDGTQLVSGHEDSSVRIWDARTGMLRTILWPENSGRILSVSWGPDGKRIAAAAVEDNGKKTLYLWDIVSEEQTLAIALGNAGTPRIGFTPDGKSIYESHPSGLWIRRWDADTGEERPGPKVTSQNIRRANSRILRGPEEQSPDGHWLILRVREGYDLIDGESGNVQHSLKGPGSIFAWSPDSAYLAWGPPAGWVNGSQIKVYDVKSGQQAFDLTDYDISCLQWSPHGRYLATGDTKHFVRVFDTSGEEVATLRGHSGEVEAVAWNPDGLRLTSAGDDGVIKVWDWTSPQAVAVLDDRNFGADLIAGLTLPQAARPWTAKRQCLAWSPDSRQLATGGSHLTIWDVHTRNPIMIINRFEWISAITWSSDSTWIVCGIGGDDGAVIGYELATGRPRFRLPHRGTIRSLRLSPGNSYLAAAEIHLTQTGERRFRSKNSAKVWELKTEQLVLEVELESSEGELSWSRDGRHFVLGPEPPWSPNPPDSYEPAEAKAWDLANGHEIEPPTNYLDAFPQRSPDGKRWIFEQFSSVLELWDSDTHELVIQLKAPMSLRGALWSPDGHWIAGSGENGTVALWDGRPPTPETSLERRALCLSKSLLRPGGHKSEALEKIQNDETLTEPLRKQASEFVESLWRGLRERTDFEMTECLLAKTAPCPTWQILGPIGYFVANRANHATKWALKNWIAFMTTPLCEPRNTWSDRGPTILVDQNSQDTVRFT